MQTRIIRWLLPIVLLAVGAGAVASIWMAAQDILALEHQARQTASRIDQADGILDSLSGLELSYARSGYVEAPALQSAFERLRRLIISNAAVLGDTLAAQTHAAASIAEISSTIGEIVRRARENLDAGQDLMAADLIFTETADARRNLREQLRALRTSELDMLAARRDTDLTQAWTALASLALLVAWALVRWPSASSKQAHSEPVSTPAVSSTVETTVPQAAVADSDLLAAAELSTDIARLDSSTEVPAVLERVSRLMHAHGVVLWMAGADELFPAAAHGYDLADLNRLGPIGRSAPNATAAAWRSRCLQIVPAEGSSRAAIAVPLLGPHRCVGVLAIEIHPTKEGDMSVQAIATMIAAQLAGVLAAWPAASNESAAADVLKFEKTAAGLPS